MHMHTASEHHFRARTHTRQCQKRIKLLFKSLSWKKPRALPVYIDQVIGDNTTNYTLGLEFVHSEDEKRMAVVRNGYVFLI